MERKKESQRLADEELAAIKSTTTIATSGTGTSGKVTRAEIESHQTRMLNTARAGGPDARAASTSAVVVNDEEMPIEENMNRMTVDGLEARSVDEAIKLLAYVIETCMGNFPRERVRE